MRFVQLSAPRGEAFVRGRGRLAAFVSAALVAVLLAGVAGAGVIQQLGGGLDGPSPAQGHAEVIAQGVAAMPAGQVAWRVVTDTAEPLDAAEYQSRALGFALATDDAIVVSSATFGSQTRLAPGEAGFVPDGAFELRSSAGGQAVPYARIALVPAEAANDDGGDTLLYGGEVFDAPALPDGFAGFDLDLVRDVLTDGESTDLPDTGYPTLLYATEGELEVQADDGDVIPLQAGEAIAVLDDLTIVEDAGGQAAFVAALIGPAVPTPTRAFGSITIGAAFCPEGMTEETFDLEECETGPVDGGLQLVRADDGATLDGEDAGAGVYVWDGIAFGAYSLADVEPREGYTLYALIGEDGAELDPDVLTVDRDTPDLVAGLFFLPVSEEAGSLSLATYACPEGMTPETMVGDACDLAEDGTYDWTIASVDGSITLTLADASGDGQPFYTWEDVPFGDYVLSPAEYPDGYGRYDIPGAEEGPQGLALVTIGEEQPDAEVLAYLFVQPDEPADAGSLTATFNLCPAGASPSDFDPSGCQPYIGADFDFAFEIANNDTGAGFSLADAALAEAAATWSDLPLGIYSLYPTPGQGYELTAILGADGGDNVNSAYVIELTSNLPDREIAIYFFPPTGNAGTVAFAAYQCPAVDSTDEDCLNAGSGAAVDADLFDGEGNPLPNTINGNNVVWGEAEGLPYETYTLVVDLSTVPEGYALDRMVGAYDDGDGDPATWMVDVTEGTPNAFVYGLLTPTA